MSKSNTTHWATVANTWLCETCALSTQTFLAKDIECQHKMQANGVESQVIEPYRERKRVRGEKRPMCGSKSMSLLTSPPRNLTFMKTMARLIQTWKKTNSDQSWTGSALLQVKKSPFYTPHWVNCVLLSAESSSENNPMCKTHSELPPTWDETSTTYHNVIRYACMKADVDKNAQE